jgi:hypothetical protein
MIDDGLLAEKLTEIRNGEITETHVCRHWFAIVKSECRRLGFEEVRRREWFAVCPEAMAAFVEGWPDVPAGAP